MTIQAFYPVFANGQVLTSGHLNNIVSYLEPQDRLTRNQLTGIGIVCGFDIDWQHPVITISAGVAITSDGYLITEDQALLDRFRDYTVPVPSADEATPQERQAARYPFLFRGNTQELAFELLPDDFIPAPGESPPQLLTQNFIKDKVVMLFLEKNRESLKNCDINDCSDKGSEMNLTLRRVLISRDLADQILEAEKSIANRPVSRALHPRSNLQPLAMEKINPSGFGIVALNQLFQRTIQIGLRAGSALLPALQEAFDAYEYLLRPAYPKSDYPAGPTAVFHLNNLFFHWAQSPEQGQYVLAALQDMISGHNEFIDKAARFDAECRPDAARFPLHVLLGDVTARRRTQVKAPKTQAEFTALEPLDLDNGPVPEGDPRRRRHYFVPSRALDNGADKLAELRALFHRIVLQGHCFFARDLLDKPIRITPSRRGAAPLSERAIPFYYRFDRTTDLFENWSWPKSRSRLLSTVWSHRFMPADLSQHPLQMRREEADFLRIEGTLGKPLGSAMTELIRQKRRLGLNFSIQPVMVPYFDTKDDFDAESRDRALAAVKQLLMCRMRDLDIIFVMFMMAMMAFLVRLIQLLGPQDATKTTRKITTEAIIATEPGRGTGGGTGTISTGRGITVPGTTGLIRGVTLAGSTTSLSDTVTADFGRFLSLSTARLRSAIKLDLKTDKLLEKTSLDLTRDLQKGTLTKAEIILKIASEGQDTQILGKQSVAEIYAKARDNNAGGELIDRVKVVAAEIDRQNPEEVASAIYPSISLMARAEELVAVASTPDLAHFDEDRFQTAIRGFADSYSTYADAAETLEDQSTAAIANQEIAAQAGTISTIGNQLGSGAFLAALMRKIRDLFEGEILQGYAPTHPGLHHEGGVPSGGTYIMLYADRRGLDAMYPKLIAEFGADFGKLFSKLTGLPAPNIDVAAARDKLMASSKPISDDLLDQFFIVGDFCLTTHCCEVDCGESRVRDRIRDGKDKVLETDVKEQPLDEGSTPGRQVANINGAVFSKPASGRISPVTSASLLLVNTKTGTKTQHDLTESEFSLFVAPGSYRLTASLRNRTSKPEEFTIGAGKIHEVRLVIT